MVGLGVERESHAQPEFGVVLEERVVPGRAPSGRVDRPGRGRQVGAVDRGAAGRVGHDHPIAKQLAHQPDVGRLATATARPRELEQWLEHLGSLDGVDRDQAAIEWRDGLEEVPARPLDVSVVGDGLHVDRLVAGVGLALGRADVDAHTTAGAIVRGHLDREPMVEQVPGAELLVEEVGRRRLDGGRREDLHPDRRVRADHRAFAAVDADTWIPDRDLLGDGPLLVFRRPAGERAVDREGADGQQVALAGDQARGEARDEVRNTSEHSGSRQRGRGRGPA